MHPDFKIAIVTGASGMIGQAITEQLRRDGLEVHALSRNGAILAELVERTGCVAHALDLSDMDGLTRLAREVQADILVHNAGVTCPGSFLDGTAEEIDVQIDVNLRSVLQLSRLVVPGMVERNRGHVVLIGSIAGHRHFPGNAAYHASKAGIAMLAQQLRIDLFGKRVRVTEISPGQVRTEIFAKTLKISFEESEKQIFEGIEPLEPEDIAAAVGFAVNEPLRMDVSYMEVVPTLQAIGGVQTARWAQ